MTQRTPLAKARITGRAVVDKSRFADRSDPNVPPLGDPSKFLNAREKNAWRVLAKEFPWLAESDRALVEIASRLRARFQTDPDMGVQALNLYRMCIGSMGGTPADRSKVPQQADDDATKDPANAYFAH